MTNEAFEIQFPSALYGSLFNASAVPGFDIALFQPNNPPGTLFGLYSALATVDHPTLPDPFRVDAVYLGQGTPSRPQSFITTFDASGNVTNSVEIGQVPEPATLAPVGIVLGLIGCSWTVRRRLRRPA